MAGFYSARDRIIPPLPWPTFAPPFSGYLALPNKAFTLAEEKIDARATGSFFDGGSKVGVTPDDLLKAAN